MQPYKFNTNNKNNRNGSNPNAMNIRKINPNTVHLKPVSRGSGVGAGLAVAKEYSTNQPNVTQTIPAAPGGDRSILGPDYMSGNQSMLSGGSLGGQPLPELKKKNRSVTRAAAGTLSSAGSGN